MIARGAMLGPDQPVVLHMLDIEPAKQASCPRLLPGCGWLGVSSRGSRSCIHSGWGRRKGGDWMPARALACQRRARWQPPAGPTERLAPAPLLKLGPHLLAPAGTGGRAHGAD